MSETNEAVAYDLSLVVNFTIDITEKDVESIQDAINSGDIEAASVEEFLTDLMISEIENQYDNNVWVPEIDSEIRTWITYADKINEKNAERVDD